MVPLGILVGSLMPWQDFEKIGPFVPGDYLLALFAFELPTLLITSALFFALATATRSMVWTYVCAVALLVLFFVGPRAGRQRPGAASTSPRCSIRSASARSTTSPSTGRPPSATRRCPPFTGVLLANRLLWTALAGAVFARRPTAPSASRCASTKPGRRRGAAGTPADRPAKPEPRAEGGAARTRPSSPRWARHNPAGVREVLAAEARRARLVLPDIPPATRATARAQLWELAKIDMAFVFRSPAYFVLVAIGLLLAAGTLRVLAATSWAARRIPSRA